MRNTTMGGDMMGEGGGYTRGDEATAAGIAAASLAKLLGGPQQVCFCNQPIIKTVLLKRCMQPQPACLTVKCAPPFG